ncbi:MAG: alpha/beta fold hydrolase [bacterium]
MSFKTRDGWTLTADWLKPAQGRCVAVMLHGLGSGRGEWTPLDEKLAVSGFGFLAADMRGHGESTLAREGKRDYRSFTKTEDWAGAVKDIAACMAFLKEKGIKENRVILAGASIGANLALNAVVSLKMEPAGLILLSPGLDYHGISTRSAIKKTGSLPVLISASRHDRYSWQSSAILTHLGGKKITFLEAPEGHGVNMFLGKANLSASVLEKVFSWIKYGTPRACP